MTNPSAKVLLMEQVVLETCKKDESRVSWCHGNAGSASQPQLVPVHIVSERINT
jgi:hypothetical protein